MLDADGRLITDLQVGGQALQFRVVASGKNQRGCLLGRQTAECLGNRRRGAQHQDGIAHDGSSRVNGQSAADHRPTASDRCRPGKLGPIPIRRNTRRSLPSRCGGFFHDSQASPLRRGKAVIGIDPGPHFRNSPRRGYMAEKTSAVGHGVFGQVDPPAVLQEQLVPAREAVPADPLPCRGNPTPGCGRRAGTRAFPNRPARCS